MTVAYQIVVCGSLVPDPLQTLEPSSEGDVPALKNEALLPAVLDPWAAHALYEAAHLARQVVGSKVYLVSVGPKAKLQQLMMSVAQKVSFELVAVDGSASGFIDAASLAVVLADTIKTIPDLDLSRLLLFGGRSSASRDAGSTLQMVGELLGITDQFVAVDELKVEADGSLQIMERVDRGQYQISVCQGPPAVMAWATGNLPEPPNNPQVGMQNMRQVMPALQKAKKVSFDSDSLDYLAVDLPKVVRQTRIVKDLPEEQIALELAEWIKG